MSEEAPECPICLEPIHEDICRTRCGHVYHSRCAFLCLQQQTRCAVCRCELVELKSPKVEGPLQAVASVRLPWVDDSDVLRLRRNYNARRRRLEARDESVRCAREAAGNARRSLIVASEVLESAWHDEIQRVVKNEKLVRLARERKLALRRLKRRTSQYQRMLDMALGERPMSATSGSQIWDLNLSLMVRHSDDI